METMEQATPNERIAIKHELSRAVNAMHTNYSHMVAGKAARGESHDLNHLRVYAREVARHRQTLSMMSPSGDWSGHDFLPHFVEGLLNQVGADIQHRTDTRRNEIQVERDNEAYAATHATGRVTDIT